MSEKLSNLINKCLPLYKGREACDNCVNNKKCQTKESCKCYDSCIYPLHRNNNCSHVYNCKNMALNYVIKHFYRFASEIAYAFRFIFNLEKENWKDTINVVSLGCGPCSELYGIVDELERQGSDLNVNYRGFDLNDIWSDIWNLNKEICNDHELNFHNCDTFEYYNDNPNSHIDVLVLNYLISDIARKKGDDKTAFLDKLVNFIDQNDIRYIIFNDIPLFYGSLNSGYSCMEYVINQFGVNKKTESDLMASRWRFSEPKQFQPTYGRKRKSSAILYTIDETAKDFEPFDYCNGIQMIVRKN